MSTQPLTEVEKAAAQELFRLSETSGGYHAAHWTIEDFADEARAVVAAVRPLIAQELVESAEIVREFAQSRPITTAEAKAIFDGITTSLSRPTSEEH
jgi:hypothetical protein